MTELELHAEGLTEPVLHLNLEYFVFFCFALFYFLFVLFLFYSPLIDNDRTTSETLSPGLEAEGLTPKLLRWKLYCILTWGFFLILFLPL
jgi:hypothetical protein